MQDPSEIAASTSIEEHRAAGPESVRVGVVTISDTRTVETDKSGQYLCEQVLQANHHLIESQIVPDDAVAIRSVLIHLMRSCEVLLITGGTGITGRDVTVPVVESLIIKPIPGFGELFRMLSYEEVGSAAMLSRATGGLGRGAVIFAMPGSLNAVQLAWQKLLVGELSHVVHEMVRHGQNYAGDTAHTGPVPRTISAVAAHPERPVTSEEVHEIWSRPFEPKNNEGASAGIGRHSKYSPVRRQKPKRDK